MESSQGIPLWLRKKSSPNTGKAIDALEPASKEGGGRKRARKSRSRRQSDAKKMENSSRTPAKKKRDRRVKSPSLASTPEKSKHSSKRHNKRTHVAVPQTPTSKEASDPQPSVVAEATANEEEGSPVVPSRVDVRRPSILKPRPRAMSWVPQLLITGIGCSPPAPRTPTVGFGPAECRSISDLTLETTYDKSEKVPHASDKQQQTRLTIEQPDQEPWKQGTVEASRGSPSHSESGVVPSPATAARSSGSALAKAPITNPGSRRTSTTSILRRDSAISLQCVPTSDGTASPTKGSISWLGQKASDGSMVAHSHLFERKIFHSARAFKQPVAEH
ncbi:uncharacterized protein LOC144180506 [Haemaphysalis longicornis]